MAPAAFALGLDVALDQFSDEEENVPWVSWYLDDGTIIGPLSEVAAYAEKLVPALASIGLQVNPSKCTLWGPDVKKEGDLCDLMPDTLLFGESAKMVGSD